MHRKAFRSLSTFYPSRKCLSAIFCPLSPFLEPKICWTEFHPKQLPFLRSREAGLNSLSLPVLPLRECRSPRVSATVGCFLGVSIPRPKRACFPGKNAQAGAYGSPTALQRRWWPLSTRTPAPAWNLGALHSNAFVWRTLTPTPGLHWKRLVVPKRTQYNHAHDGSLGSAR